MIARHVKDFTWNRGWNSNSPPPARLWWLNSLLPGTAKVSNARGIPGGAGHVEASIWPIHNHNQRGPCNIKFVIYAIFAKIATFQGEARWTFAIFDIFTTFAICKGLCHVIWIFVKTLAGVRHIWHICRVRQIYHICQNSPSCIRHFRHCWLVFTTFIILICHFRQNHHYSRGHFWHPNWLALDNIEWSQIGHLMHFTQRIISIMERDWNVEWG